MLKVVFFSSIFIFIANLQRNEGLELLAPFFQKLPQAFAGLAEALRQLYQEACRKAVREPDGELLSQFNSAQN
ncbi:MAG: hypothetical protein WBL87_06820 [Methanothrix sp.]